jgi:dihydrofolate reductase
LGLFISLDGVVEFPEKWAFTYLNDEVSKGIAAGIAQADAVLLGRRTYQQFAKIWPGDPSGWNFFCTPIACGRKRMGGPAGTAKC